MIRTQLTIAALVVASATGVAAQLALISVADEIQLGRDAQREMRKKVPHIDGAVQTYIAGIGRRLAAHADGPRYPYSFSIANDRRINAFALPGGPVWIDRGAIEAATNEAQVAGVLAHEVAHIAQRHAAQQISNGAIANGLLGLLGAVLGNAGGAATAETGARVLAGGYMLKFSRADEMEADSVGMDIVRRAGWDARGMLDFMQMLRARAGRDPSSVETFLSSHPAPVERLERIRGDLRRARPGGQRDSADFHVARHTLAAIPR
jgi:beta-barrel assembly-enhancing protease